MDRYGVDANVAPRPDRLGERFEVSVHCHLERTADGGFLRRARTERFQARLVDLSVAGLGLDVEAKPDLFETRSVIELVTESGATGTLRIRSVRTVDGITKVGCEIGYLSPELTEEFNTLIAAARGDHGELTKFWRTAH